MSIISQIHIIANILHFVIFEAEIPCHHQYDGEVVVKREFSEYRKTLPNRTA